MPPPRLDGYEAMLKKLRLLLPGRTDTQMFRDIAKRYIYIMENSPKPDELQALIKFWQSEADKPTDED